MKLEHEKIDEQFFFRKPNETQGLTNLLEFHYTSLSNLIRNTPVYNC